MGPISAGSPSAYSAFMKNKLSFDGAIFFNSFMDLKVGNREAKLNLRPAQLNDQCTWKVIV